MRKIILAIIILVIGLTGFTQQPADKIIGQWESIDGEVKLKFEIFKQDGKYFGKLLWASNMFEIDSKIPKKDNNNPNKSLRDRSRQGIVNITNLKFEKGEYSGGKLYNPEDGDIYSLNAKLRTENELHFRGYLGISLLGKTMKFKRIQ
ncbi:DUF2147 domain-containing protein [Pseudobacter ginsenosidimutans]|uniref:Uncharacterized protein DUF2147 n=1 Tax=Pseudobacter ginsenosidimutans TaxID=661488 RepID=A0A4V2F1W7_9BACT|nr:DUF2147 domain-containing protein [Pseudobacter ginsenosidimutans]QEC43797.1 DUF2147 domain-containing protein [Pseudobacter ginsenosidimutans]RZS75216.1 uncharacterized protein DUF2147 [Pseudobacter ginsenosidimutans]